MRDMSNNCINVWIATTSDCTDKNIGNNGDKINVNCNGLTPESTTYSTSTSPLSITSNKDNIKAYTNYSVTVQAVNGWGYGIHITKSLTTAQYKPKAPASLILSSTFPNNKIKIQWTTPFTSNEAISQYQLVMRDMYNNCINVWIVTCSDCTDKNIGNNGDKINETCNGITPELTTYSIYTSPSVTTNKDNIKVYTNYSVTIQAVNGWGYGDSSTESLITAQKNTEESTSESEAPASLTLSSKFPNETMKIQWTAPSISNGAICQYVVVLRDMSNNCINVWIVTCSDCTDKIIGNNGVNINLNCNGITPESTTYLTSTSPLSITSNNLKSYTSYSVSVQAVNSWGYGKSRTKSITTPYKKSEPPSFIKFNAEFPSGKLIIHLNPTIIPNGKVFRYLVTAQSNKMTSCILWNSTCTSCDKKNAHFDRGDRIDGCNKDNNNIIISNSVVTFPFILVLETTQPSIILPNTEYILKAQAVNQWGNGKIVTTSYKTLQYKSDAPVSLSLSSTFPNEKIKIQWTAPSTSNGAIFQYLIVMRGMFNKCINLWIVTCSDCTDKNIGNNGDKINETCNGITPESNTYLTSTSPLSITSNKDNIKAYTDYLVTVQPVNGWGYGNSITKSIQTPIYQSGPPSFIEFYAEFPAGKLTVHLNQTSDPNGVIMEYLVTAKSNQMPYCICWYYHRNSYKLEDTRENGTAIYNCYKVGYTDVPFHFENFPNTIVLQYIQPSHILPYTTYTIRAQALSNWGHGEISSAYYTTPQYKSETPASLTLSSTFLNEKIKIQWTAPSTPNGVISQYLVIMEDEFYNCINVWIVTCSDCTDKNIIDNGYKITKTCNGITPEYTKYSTSTSPLSITSNKDNIKAYTDYSVTVQPVNGWGYGNSITESIQTPIYQSGPPHFIKYYAEFPSGKLTVHLNQTSAPNGEIMEYLVTAQSNQMPYCICWYYHRKSYTLEDTRERGTPIYNCNNNQKTNIPIFVDNFPNTFLMDTTQPSNILPYTTYTIRAQTISNWGHGEINTIYYTTPQYKSEAPASLTLSSIFPNEKIKIQWTTPSTSNGAISQYLVVMQDMSNNCINVWIVTCSDCTDKNIGNNGVNINLNCNGITPELATYSKSTTPLSITSNKENIKAHLNYAVTVQAVNGWGYGNSSTKLIMTPQYKPGSPSFIKYNAEFPFGKLILNLNPNSTPNEKVFQYIASAQSSKMTSCILWYITCTSCDDKISNFNQRADRIDGCNNNHHSNISNKVDSFPPILVFETIQPSNILPYTTYTLKAQAVNQWGTGEIVSTSYRTPQYESEAPSSLTLSSTFPNEKIKIQWTAPSTSNGAISQYLVVMQDMSYNCINVWIVTCSDCTDKNIGNNGVNIRINCNGITPESITYLTSTSSLSITSNNGNIKARSNYAVTVQAVNGWGYGKSKTRRVTTVTNYQ